MRHDLTQEGRLYRLRPVELEDAAFIVEIRTDPRSNSFVNPISSDIDQQKEWIRRYFNTPDDYYFIVENRSTGEPEATVAIYNYAEDDRRAQWGRWVIRHGSKCGVACIALSFALAFDQLGLDALYTETATASQGAIMLLERFGMAKKRDLPGYALHGRTYEVAEYQLTKSYWTLLQHATV